MSKISESLFLERHGPQWAALQRDLMFADLLALLRTKDPARATPGLTSTDATENAQHLLGRISGFNLLMNFLDGGITAYVAPEPPAQNYEEEKEPQTDE